MRQRKLIVSALMAALLITACSDRSSIDENKLSEASTPLSETEEQVSEKQSEDKATSAETVAGSIAETTTKESRIESVAEESTEEPTEELTEEPAEELTEEPTEEPTEESADPHSYLFKSGRRLDLGNIPRVDGALALEPFYDAVFADLLGITPDDARSLLACNNTPQAYLDLTLGNVDMIFCALPSNEQVEYAEKKGVEFDYTTILSGGFVFFVNKDNPVNSVTQEELKGIVSGKITNWKELGGDDEPIVLFQRNEGSGSQSGLYRYVLPPEEVMPPKKKERINGMGDVVDMVAVYESGKGAISFSYYYYIANMYYTDDIKLLAIDGIMPSDETIANGEYPFLNFSQIVTRKDLPEDSIVNDIIEYVTSEEGARIARENGYVPYEAGGAK